MSKFKNIYEINEVTHPEVKHARIRLNNGWDIVRLTYTDSGFIQIYSSFGHYAYHWTAMGEGVTLQQFFGKRASGDNHYLANKLWSSTRENEEYFDADDAVKEIGEYLLDYDQSSSYLEKDDDIYKEIMSEAEDVKSCSGDNRDLFIHHWMSTEILNEWIPEFYEHSFGMRKKGRYNVLLNEIIPLIQDYFNGQLEQKK